MAAPGREAAGGGPGDRAAARAVPGMQRWRRRGLGALCAGLCAGSELWSHAWTLPAEGRRRDVLCVGPAVGLAATPWSLPASAAEKTALQLRFNGTEVDKLPSGYIPGWGPDDLYYPEWMEGRWRVEQTLESYAAPLGKQFLANGQSAVANKVLSEQQNQLGKTVDFELRYLRTQRNNIVEDRAYNTRAKLNAFAGREVVKNVEYVEVQDNTRELATRAGNGESDPLRNVLVNFKGAVQKVFITAFETELSPENDIWRGVASTRTLFAAPGAGYNPLTVDEEVVTALKKTDTGVRGRLRLLGFLNPNDQLFFKAGNRAVSIADYSLKYTRIEESTA